MNYQEIQHYLEEMASNCHNLAKKLGEEGRALTTDEEQLITFAHMPMLRECYEIGVGCLVAGNVKTAYEHFIRMAEIADRRGAK